MAYSIWLEFDEASTSILQNEIRTLSEVLGSPSFEPHLTLVGDIDLPVEAVTALAEKFGRCSVSSTIKIKQVSLAQSYFMALFLSVDMPDQLLVTRKQISQDVSSSSYLLDDPHISLAYGSFEKGIDCKIIARLEKVFVGTCLYARRLNIVQSSKRTPISEWRTVGQVNFC
jgi:2'-5' RNA ligase